MGRTNVSRRRQQTASARERAAAARAAAAKQQRRRRLLIVLGSAVGVLAVVGVIVAVGLSSSGKKADTTRPDASPALVAAVSGVPAATLDAVGKGALSAAPKPATDSLLSASGQPEVLYIGTEFCPYCAAERWPLVQALSRFGTFTGLKTMHSSPTDVFPNTATFSFYGSHYTSDVLSFVPRELETVTGAPLEKATDAESALWLHYTGKGTFPFLEIAGKYVVTGPSYDPSVLKGLTAAEIAGQLADPSSQVARAVDGAANVLTAAICKTTAGRPSAVCTAPGVVAAGKTLDG